MARVLLFSLFSVDVLVNSNLTGGASKMNVDKRRQPLEAIFGDFMGHSSGITYGKTAARPDLSPDSPGYESIRHCHTLPTNMKVNPEKVKQ
ncbi:hypothetical protein AAFF_G00137850 [Aldrovandia affinis]|uniref:Uncharacterized protein n=1 Tax=Aldrovandia affinis TaxID=143900 RepID=A0AAD7X1W7_9TELE|nr:hypothetical protein AAFF_G00137850 [Aldrovandia affinis]